MLGNLEKERVFLISKSFLRQFDAIPYRLIKEYYMNSYYLAVDDNVEVRAVEIVSKDGTKYMLDTKIRTGNDGKGWKESNKISTPLTKEEFTNITKRLIPIYKRHKVYHNNRTNTDICVMSIDSGAMYLVEIESDDPLSIDVKDIIGKEVTNDKHFYMSEYWKRKKQSKY